MAVFPDLLVADPFAVRCDAAVTWGFPDLSAGLPRPSPHLVVRWPDESVTTERADVNLGKRETVRLSCRMRYSDFKY